MKWCDVTFDTPAENLACDEALLDLCDYEGIETLRFWESRQPFVVVGYGNHVEREVKVDECRRRGVPILRRCSGGGTVVQGPGCLNYTVTLRIPESGLLATVTGTNAFVMERNRGALEGLLDRRIAVQGHTDLAFADRVGREALIQPHSSWLKFSGNAQRRRQHALIFHGTFLHNFEIGLIESLLLAPSAQPEYRANRNHEEFVGNIPVRADLIRAALREAWNAREVILEVPRDRFDRVLREHYLNDAWNFRTSPPSVARTETTD